MEPPDKNVIKFTQSNFLIEASYRLSLIEKRVILCLLNKIDPRKPMPKLFYLTAKEYAELTHTDLKNAYNDLKTGGHALLGKKIILLDRKNKSGLGRIWLDRFDYFDKEARIQASFSHWIYPYISQLAKQFTSIEFRQVARFKSYYAIRLFELLMQFEKTGKRLITIEKLKTILGIEKEYPRYTNLKARVIEPSIREINEKSGYTAEYSQIKTGRIITSLRFTFRKNRQNDLFE